MPELTGTLKVPRLAAAPSSPVQGQMYFDTVTDVLYYWDGITWVSGAVGPTGYDTAPIGSVITTTRRTWDEEYVLADGQTLTEALYPDCCAVAAAEVAAGNPLWSVSGTAPARTFTVPDLRDRFLYSQGTKAQGVKSQTNPALANPGEETHTLSSVESGQKASTAGSAIINETTDHTHSIAPNLAVQGAGGAGYAYVTNAGSAIIEVMSTTSTGRSSSHSHGINGSPATTPHNNMPPYVVLAFLVKVKGVKITSGAIVGPPGVNGAPGGQVFTQIIGDGAATSFTVSHGLGTRNVNVSVYRSASPYDELIADVERTDSSTVTIRTYPTVPAVGEYTVAVAAPGTQATLDITMDTWHLVGAAGEPAFATGCANFGGAWNDVGFRKMPDGRVQLKGLVSASSALSAGATLFTLPVGYRPPKQAALDAINNNNAATRVDVIADGRVLTASAVGAGGWVGIEGLIFDTETVLQTASVAAQPLDPVHYIGAAGEPTFANAWVNLDNNAAVPGTATQRAAGFRRTPEGKVRFTGVIKGGGNGQTIFTLPVGYRPRTNELSQIVYASGGLAAVSVSATGVVSAGGISPANITAWVYLDGVEFDTESVGAYVTGVLGPPFVTALPTNPINGQECYYVANATDGVIWHLRYNANSASAYKWEFLGGSMLDSGFYGSSNTVGAGSSYSTQLADGTAIVGITAPLAGDYFVQGNCIVSVGDGTVRNCGVGVYKSTDSNPSVSTQMASVTGGGIGQAHFSGPVKGVLAATRLTMCYLYIPVVATYGYRQFFARPIRVG